MKKNKKNIIVWSSIILGIVVLLILRFMPLNYYIETPGSANNLERFVSMPTRPDRHKGSFMITSVYLQRATPITYALAKADPHASIEKEDAVTGGENAQVYSKVQRFYMNSAINEAIATAFKAAHQSYHKNYLGIYVLSISKNSDFKHKIHVGDTITKVNGVHYNYAEGYQKALAKLKVHHKVKITYKHDGVQKIATGRLIKLPTGKSGIGIMLTDNVKVHTDIPIKVNSQNIGGPSGGLMFSLQIYQQLTNDNLTNGRKIAGTGTINRYGYVGEIGGIDKKVIAAHKAGAKIFFAPYIKPYKIILKYEPQHMTNYQLAKKTAKKYAPNMKIVPVSTFEQAVHYLQTHR